MNAADLLLSLVLAASPLAAQTRSAVPGGLPLPDAPLAETVASPGLPVSLEPALGLPLGDASLSTLPQQALSAPRSAPLAAPLHAAAGDKGPGLGARIKKALGLDRPKRPSDRELEKLFDAAVPGSIAVDALNDEHGFTVTAGELLGQYSFISADARREHGVPGSGPMSDLVGVMDRDEEPANRAFLEALGRRAAHDLYSGFKKGRIQAPERPFLPENPLGKGDYWDMASGLNAAGFILLEQKKDTHYHYFDRSPFVTAHLRELAALTGADATVHEADIMTLERPAQPLAVLRTKNAITYVAGFEKKLEEMAGWIAPGGQLVIQNDANPAQHRDLVAFHSELALRLLEEGWDLEYQFAAAGEARYELDTLIFTRPAGPPQPRSREDAEKFWSRFVETGKRLYSRPRGIFIIMGR
jgi:hypothetical protein